MAAVALLRQRFPRGQFVTLAAARHLPQIENAQEVARCFFTTVLPTIRHKIGRIHNLRGIASSADAK